MPETAIQAPLLDPQFLLHLYNAAKRANAMNTIEATIENRRIDVPAPADLPDGTKVVVDVTPLPKEKIGIDESEWRDDPEALADWDAWLKSIEPIAWNAADQFDSEYRRFNLEAVRKQMEEGP